MAVLIVAQRVSTIKDADQIIVLNDGEMVGKGRHLELIKSCKVYREIVKSQLSDKEFKAELVQAEKFAEKKAGSANKATSRETKVATHEAKNWSRDDGPGDDARPKSLPGEAEYA